MTSINIAKDYARNLGGRYIKHGPLSGEHFRQTFLEKLFEDEGDDSPIEINLNGLRAHPPSFFDEAFGGLARIYGKERVLKRIEFISADNPRLLKKIRNYIETCDENS